MASYPIGSGSAVPPEWHPTAPADPRSQLMACLRASLIALALLAGLALIVWL